MGSLGEESSLWFQITNQVSPSLWHSLTPPLGLLPGSQVQPGKGVTADKVSRVRVGHEDVVLRHGGDAGVVTDDAGQGDVGQGLSLLCAEHTSVLPPKPVWEGASQTSCLRLARAGRTSPGLG